MMRTLIIGLVALGLGMNAYADDDVGTKPEWFACTKDSDCGRSETVCGAPKGINLKQYKEYAKYLKAQRAMSDDCTPTPKIANLRELKSICISSVCKFNTEPQYGAH